MVRSRSRSAAMASRRSELTIGMEPALFLPLFEQWNLPEGWLAGLIDRDGNFIARSRNHEHHVGRPAPKTFAAPCTAPPRAGTR